MSRPDMYRLFRDATGLSPWTPRGMSGYDHTVTTPDGFDATLLGSAEPHVRRNHEAEEPPKDLVLFVRGLDETVRTPVGTTDDVRPEAIRAALDSSVERLRVALDAAVAEVPEGLTYDVYSQGRGHDGGLWSRWYTMATGGYTFGVRPLLLQLATMEKFTPEMRTAFLRARAGDHLLLETGWQSYINIYVRAQSTVVKAPT